MFLSEFEVVGCGRILKGEGRIILILIGWPLKVEYHVVTKRVERDFVECTMTSGLIPLIQDFTGI